MKKIFLIIMLFTLSGCFNKHDVMVCTNKIKNDSQNYESNITYNIYSKNNEVTKIEIEEIYKSNDSNIINYFNQSRKAIYENYNDFYTGYDYEVEKQNNKIVFDVIIDYSKVNTKKMIKDKKLVSDFVNSRKKLTKSGAKSMYEQIGATCK